MYQSLAGHNGASLAEAAQDDIATRYALYKLNPFAVSGPGLYDVINTDHALDRYDPATRTGALTDEYLTDRAEFLGAKISSANQNFEYQDKPWAPYGGAALGPARYFKDNESGYAVYAGLDRNVTQKPLNTLSQYLFGAAKDDPNLTGGDKGDKLYGMDGNDTLQGKKGNDYLEGGRDYDTYIFTTGDGQDTILDTDLQGQILWDGTALQGGAFVAGVEGQGGIYRDASGEFSYRYALNPQTQRYELRILKNDSLSGPSDSITVQDYTAGALGIRLDGAEPITYLNLFQGDSQTDLNTGELITRDLLVGTDANDRIFGLTEDDDLRGGAGDDYLEGGTGDDLLIGDGGSETGPIGNDTLYGNEGDDVLLGATLCLPNTPSSRKLAYSKTQAYRQAA